MGGNLFRPGRDLQDLVFVRASRRKHLLHHEIALRHGAGLVHDDRRHVLQHFHGVAALEQDADLGAGSDAREEGQRHGEHQRAGAADDKEGQRGVNPLVPFARHQGRNNRHRKRKRHHDRRIDPREARDEFVDIRLVGRRVFHGIQNLRDHGFLQFLFHANLQHAGGVHAAGQYLVAEGFPHGHRLSGDRGRVELALAVDDDAVQRDTVADAHQQDVADPGFRRRNDLHVVAHQQIDNFGAHIHRVHDLVAAPVGSPVLEPFADPVEEDDAHRFFPCLNGKGAQCGYGHQEVLVKEFAFRQVLQGGKHDLPAQDHIGYDQAVHVVLLRHEAQPLRHDEDRAADYKLEDFPSVFAEEGFLFPFAVRNGRVVFPLHDGHAVFHFVGDGLHFGGEAVVAPGGDAELSGSVYQHGVVHFRHRLDGVLHLGGASRAVESLHVVGAEFRGAELFLFGNRHALFRFICGRLHLRQKAVVAAGADAQLSGLVNQYRLVHDGQRCDSVLHLDGAGGAVKAVHLVRPIFLLRGGTDALRDGHAVFRFLRGGLQFRQQPVVIVGGDAKLSGLVNQRSHRHARYGGDSVLYLDGAGGAIEAVHLVGAEFVGLLRAFFPRNDRDIRQERTAYLLEYRQHGVRILGRDAELFRAVADGRIVYARQGFDLMLDLGRANWAVQIDQFVNALDIFRVRHAALAVSQTFSAIIAIFLMRIAFLAGTFVRMACHMRFMSIGRVMMHQLMLAVVVRFFGSMVMVVIVSMIMSVVMAVSMVMTVIVVVVMSVFMIMPVVVLMVMIVVMVMLMLVSVVMFVIIDVVVLMVVLVIV